MFDSNAEGAVFHGCTDAQTDKTELSKYTGNRSVPAAWEHAFAQGSCAVMRAFLLVVDEFAQAIG